MTAEDASAAMLAEMGACAHRLGMAFGREAERVEDWTRKLELFDLFERCFFGVRVSIALGLRLRRAPSAALGRDAAGEAEDFHERADPPETEARERLDTDRERETERATLPLLLSTLCGIAKDAAALPGPAPAALTALTALLARAGGDPGRRPTPNGLRHRPTGATAVAIATGPPRTNIATTVALLARRPRSATGPPRR
ncbi:MAG: hypothetical protein KKE02_19435 [Alphaproteobacteria bacterium]|nr:hypothetical protein [Alphaproteobacteria bacterium]MBU1512819.1 hypothetical protein [Alphaproteobacteria bacterium]MBU2095745.1 hypothetical protein [Alphaproteobacteria bacterium]MBU2153201.1 hypothetical protein [Alphaproteobacteria bacterium]MBU2308987.1 hypothetical protein [Alphaproteobacteria bacterium]